MSTLLQDLRYAVRMLVKSPGFTVLVVAILGLGIGANTAIFGVLHAFLLRPLPFDREQELVTLYESNPSRGIPEYAVSGTKYLDWREHNDVFQDMGALQGAEFTLAGRGEPTPVTAFKVTPSYLSLLRIQPRLGRLFVEAEGHAGKDQVVVLGHRLWKYRFGGREDIVGQSVRLDDTSRTVIGVLPPGLAFLEGDDVLFVPLSQEKVGEDRGRRHEFQAIARLKPGASIAQSQAAMDVMARHAQVYDWPGWGVVIKPLRKDLLSSWPDRRTILLLQGAVLLVMLIACSNAANLLLTRSTSREREIAIRLTLGGSASHVVRQLLIESLLMASLAGAAGIALAALGIEGLNAWLRGQRIVLWSAIRLDPAVLGFSLLLSLTTGVVFGLVPAWRMAKANIQSSLGRATRGATHAIAHRRTVDVLVVAEMGLAVMLLVGAGLLVRSLLQLRGTDPGFDPTNVLTMRVTLPASGYAQDAQRSRFFDQALERVRALPGVRHVAVIDTLPMSATFQLTFAIEGSGSESPNDRDHGAEGRRISADYFRTMRARLVQGRFFEAADRKDAQSVVIVNQCLARRFFPDGNVLGARLSLSDGMTNPRTVVGVVNNERVLGLAGDTVPMFYVPYDQGQWAIGTTFHFLVRADSPPLALVRSVQGAIREVDPQMAFASVLPMDHLVSSSIFSERVASFLLGLFSLFALLLATVGVYGVMASAVSQRTQEIGIRIALGARPSQVLRLVVRRGLALAATGLGLGLAGALAFTRYLTSFLHGISPTDPWTFAVLTLLLAAVALAACWLPARRTAKVDPMVALRCE